MNTARFLLSCVGVFIYVFFFEFLFHGHLMKDYYIETASMWRPESEMMMPYMLASQIGFSILIAFIFTRHYENKGLGEGARFGFMMGLLLAVLALGSYSYMNITLSVTIGWMVANLLKAFGAGLVCALLYKR